MNVLCFEVVQGFNNALVDRTCAPTSAAARQ